MILRPWQQAVFDELVAERPDVSGLSAHAYNEIFGIRVNFGRRKGHSTLARELLRRLPNCILVVPNEEAPFARKKQHVKALTADGLFTLTPKIWVARPVDIVAAIAGEPTRDDLLNKMVAPFSGATSCIIDDASFMSQDELRLLRSIGWERYVELA